MRWTSYKYDVKYWELYDMKKECLPSNRDKDGEKEVDQGSRNIRRDYRSIKVVLSTCLLDVFKE